MLVIWCVYPAPSSPLVIYDHHAVSLSLWFVHVSIDAIVFLSTTLATILSFRLVWLQNSNYF